jgi:TonB family protein
MRSGFILLYTVVLMISTGAFPQQANQESPPYEPPAVVSATETVYPIRSVASGTVVLEAALDNTGAITGVRVVRGIPSLTQEAERALRQWKFQPARLNGRSVSSKIPVGFVFVPPSFGPRR